MNSKRHPPRLHRPFPGRRGGFRPRRKRLPACGPSSFRRTSHLRTDGGERPRKKTQWGTLNGCWVLHDPHNEVVDYLRRWHERTEIPVRKFVVWLGIAQSKLLDWKEHYGKRNEHNG